MKNKFKVISMGRVGTLAINRFLNNHPEIYVPSYKDSTAALKKTNGIFADIFNDKTHQSKKQGIVIHDATFFDKKYRKMVKQMNDTKVENIVHLVRNPFEQVISWINHINASALIGILGWKSIPATAHGFYKHYPIHFQSIQPGFQCKSFYKNNTNCKVVDFPMMSASNIEQTLSDIYQFLGVDNQFKNLSSQNTQNNYTRELLSKGIAFQLNNEIIEMVMLPVDLFFHHDKNSKPWVTIHDTQKIYELCPTLPALDGDLLFLPKSIKAHNNLTLKTRQMLSQGIVNIVREVLPVWAKNAEATAQRIEETKLKKLSAQDIDFLQKTLKPDLDLFQSYHPQFKQLWPF